jgi:Domain of unknown function (DUF4249)
MKNVKCSLVLMILTMGCKTAYNPPEIANTANYLVVEGIINTGNDSTIIKLSRTVNLSSNNAINPETGAIVTVESNANGSYPLREIRKGYYAAFGLNLDNTKQYRLRINTANKEQYVSDFVDAKVTPPIDSLGYNVTANGIQLYVNTHDPSNATQYYRWDYVETWQFHSKYLSTYLLVGQNFIPRTLDQLVYNCFGSDSSSNILLTSTANLTRAVVYQFPITTIAAASEKIETKYSIILRQYALTGDAYSYWQNLAKNTEQLGGIFDAQPTSNGGNIHNVNNPLVPAIGFISAGTISSKRIFIANSQLPTSWVTSYPYDCPLDSGYYCDPRDPPCLNTVYNDFLKPYPPLMPINPITTPGDSIPSGYTGSFPDCVDCTLRGTKQQPAFWK